MGMTDDKLDDILHGVYARGQIMGTIQSLEGCIEIIKAAPESSWKRENLIILNDALKRIRQKQKDFKSDFPLTV